MKHRRSTRYRLVPDWCAFLWLPIVVLVSACATPDLEPQRAPVIPEVADQATSRAPASGIALDRSSTAINRDSASVEYVDGTGRLYRSGQTRGGNVLDDAADGINLQFRDTPLSTVLDAVLVDTLGVGYQIEGNLDTRISLATHKPVSADRLLYILETALRSSNIALIEEGGSYRVMPLGEAARRSGLRTDSRQLRTGAGYSVQVVPLRYSVPTEMRRLLTDLVPSGGILAADDARSLLIIGGTRADMDTMLSMVDMFDVNWMAGMSFALYELQYAPAEEIAEELSELFGDANAPVAGAVRFVPIPRLNRLLAISAQPQYLRDVESWIDRLDIGGSVPGQRIYVYNVQNGRASDLAQTLNTLFGTGPRTGARDRQSTPTIPGTQSGTPAPVPAASGQIGASPLDGPATASTVAAGAGLRIVPSEENNSIVILADPAQFGVIEAALHRLDEAPRQVLIEASLAEVTLSDDLRFGVQWFFESSDGEVRLSESSSGGVAPAFPGFSYLYNGASDVRAVLNALESVTDVKLISSPKLLVLNNQSATLRVGDEVPVPVQSAINTTDPDAPIVNSVEYRNTGVILSVTPRINEGGLIYLDVTQEVSDVAQTTSSGIDAPTIQQRKVESTVAVQGGETIALGGLIRETDSLTRAGVPFLHRIPVIGGLFGRRNLTSRRTELVVFLTPRVINDTTDVRNVMQHLRERFEAIERSITE